MPVRYNKTDLQIRELKKQLQDKVRQLEAQQVITAISVKEIGREFIRKK